MKRRRENKRRAGRRKAERLYSSICVKYKTLDKKSHYNWIAYNDISGIGIGLLSNTSFRPGDKVKVQDVLFQAVRGLEQGEVPQGDLDGMGLG